MDTTTTQPEPFFPAVPVVPQSTDQLLGCLVSLVVAWLLGRARRGRRSS